jgi:hypothetical protein
MKNFLYSLVAILTLSSCSHSVQVDYKIAPKITFETPIKCKFGKDCFIQKYVDHGKDKAIFDYGCNVRTSNDFDGTLFRLRHSKMIKENVPVLAATSGQISRICVNPKSDDANCPVQMMQEMGDHIVINHNNGWQTYYGHLKTGSVKVKVGEYVKTSQQIASVGSRKKDGLPVLDFRTLFNGYTIDPFVGTVEFENCHHDIAPIWSKKSFNQMKYKDVDIIIGTFSDKEPIHDNVITGYNEIESINPELEKFSFWVEVLGTKKGDREKIEIIDNDGNTVASNVIKLKTANDRHIARLTANKPFEGWNSGLYTAYYTLLRNDRYIVVYRKEIGFKK